MGLGSGIQDRGSEKKTYSGSRIRSKRHRIPDPYPQHWIQSRLTDQDHYQKSLGSGITLSPVAVVGLQEPLLAEVVDFLAPRHS